MLFMSQNIDWGFVLTAGGFVIGVISLFIGGKKIVQKITTKTKYGDIDMSRSEFTIKKEVHEYKDKGKE